MEFTISSNQILAFCAIVTAVWGVWKIIKELREPNDELKRTVKKHSEILDRDNVRLKEIESSNRMILQSLLVLINHNITGNSIDKMKTIRDELQDFLINK